MPQIQNKPVLFWFIILLTSITFFYPNQTNIFLDAWLHSHSYSHGILLLAVTTYLLFSKPESLIESRGSYWFLILLSLLVILGTIASIIKIDVVIRFLLPCYIIVSVGAVFGFQNLRKFLLPLALLLFSVPSWSIISPIFQAIAAVAVASISGFIGIPTFIEGNYISIPNGTFVIAEGCSGVRYILVAVSIAIINNELSNYKLKDTIITLSLAFLMAVIANWVRIQVIVIYAHLNGMDHPTVADHNSLGWVVFAIFMAIFFLVLPLISVARPPPASIDKPMINNSQKLKATIALFTLAISYIAHNIYFDENKDKSINSNEYASNTMNQMHSFSYATTINSFGEEHLTSELYFDLRDRSADMTHADNHPISSKVRLREHISLGIEDIKTSIISFEGQYYFYSYWYNINNKITTSKNMSKLLSVNTLLSGTHINKAVFVATPCYNRCNNITPHKNYVSKLVNQ